MDRRKFIRRLSRGAATIWIAPQILYSCSKERVYDSSESETENPENSSSHSVGSVIVIGAGAAGMRAASWLKSKGHTVKILESSERRGGRIKAINGFADFPIEAGAEIIHGNNSILYNWAVQQGAQFVDYNSMDYYRLDGLLKRETQIASDPDVQAVWRFIDRMPNYSGVDKTVAQRAAQMGIANRVLHFSNADLGNDWGMDDDHVSILGMAEEDNAWSAGNQDYPMKNLTFSQILDAKCGNILPDIVYNTKVVEIEYNSGSTPPRVKDQNGVWHTADAVLLTVPLSILQNNTIQFSPALPTWKVNSINNIGMGKGMKIMLKFDNRFWAANLGYLVSDQLGHVAWYTSKQRGNDQVLTFFVMGNRAQTLSAQGTGAVTTLLNELDGLFGNAAATNAFLDAHIEDWTQNPHIQGSYSYPKVGGGGLATRRKLARQLNDKLFFAGEATHFGGHNSTVHGALQTGIRAARQINAIL